jgi:hypothetical protein
MVAGSGNDAISYVYSKTTSNSPLREVIVDNYFSSVMVSEYTLKNLEVPGISEFYYELAMRGPKAGRKGYVVLREATPGRTLRAPIIIIPGNRKGMIVQRYVYLLSQSVLDSLTHSKSHCSKLIVLLLHRNNRTQS